MRSSAVFGLADRALNLVCRAAGSSAIAASAARVIASWRAQPVSTRRFFSGVMLVAAVPVHVGLMVWQETPPGWLWLILPGIVLMMGLLLIVASGAMDGSKDPR